MPILRKADLPALQREALPFGGLVPAAPGSFGRLFTSPGPIFEPEGTAVDAWGAARGLRAAGFRPGDIVWFEPGEKHWHGASPQTAMTHIALQEVKDGKVVDWMEHVTDAEYGA